MTDARSLLKAKRAENSAASRITHPFASYTSSGQLRCLACGISIKHASAWEGHLGSKSHRTTVARLKEEERIKEQQEEEKRRGEDEAKARQGIKADERIIGGKRKQDAIADENSSDSRTKKQKSNRALPADFFSDRSHAPAPSYSDSDEEEEEKNSDINPSPSKSSALDLEWEFFQREVVNAPQFNSDIPDAQEIYANATVTAEPELIDAETADFPLRNTINPPESEIGAGEDDGRRATQGGQTKEPSEGELRHKKEQEERELIMDRLLEEERAQEEADMKVNRMKSRLDAVRKKREATKAAGLNLKADS